MTSETYSDEEAVLAFIDTQFAQTVYETVPDGTTVAAVNGNISPYLTVEFGSVGPSIQGRGITPEQHQPTLNRVVVSVVAQTQSIARQLKSKVAKGYLNDGVLGFKPSSNAGQLGFVGGGSFRINGTTTRPTLYVYSVYFSWVGNMDVDYSK